MLNAALALIGGLFKAKSPTQLGALAQLGRGYTNRNPHFTKAGPGREHRQGKAHKRLTRALGPNTYAEHDAAVSKRLRVIADFNAVHAA